MDGAKAHNPYSIFKARARPRYVRGHDDRRKAWGASLGGAIVSANLCGNSKYSNENFEGRRGERFHVNDTWTWVNRS